MGGVLCAGLVIFASHVFESRALAVDTMADWTGENTNAGNYTFTVATSNNNYGLISNTSVGGDVQSKYNWQGLEGYSGAQAAVQHVYFSDQALDGPTLSFTTPLHMEGTLTFNSPTNTEPNFCFCWYNGSDTAHRIGFGISNLTVAENPAGVGNGGTPQGAVANMLRIDVGYAASGGNYFTFVSGDGTNDQANLNSVLPNGTYPFSFDYTPGSGPTPGGSISLTVGTFFHTTAPIGVITPAQADYNNNNSVDAGDYVAFRKGGTLSNEVDNPGTTDAGDYGPWRARYGEARYGTATKPWDTDFFTFDKFGFLQRSTGSATQNPTNTYNLVISNVSYTGGTAVSGSGSGLGAGAVPEPTTAALAWLFGLTAIALRRRSR
jgi:hypothetical protein